MLDLLTPNRVRPESRLDGCHDRIVHFQGQLDVTAEVVEQVLLRLRIDARISALPLSLELLAELHHISEKLLVLDLLLQIVGQKFLEDMVKLCEELKAEKESRDPRIDTEAKKNLLDKWNGMKVKDAKNMKVDAVTGATYSSKAVIENVQLGLDYYSKH